MAKELLNGYQLSRIWFDWCFENPELISPNHSALYFFCIEHCNRLGWKEKFGLPTTMAKEAIGIKNYRTYIKTLNELVDFGFLIMIEKSKNQYSANIIALVQNTKALTKALDKALIKHGTKQGQSIDSIDKQLTINKEPITNSLGEKSPPPKTLEDRENDFMVSLTEFVAEYSKETVRAFFDYWTEKNPQGKKMRFEMEKTFEVKKRLTTWKNKENQFNQKNNSFNGKPKQTTFDKLQSASEEARAIREKRRAQSNDNGEEIDFAHYTPVD